MSDNKTFQFELVSPEKKLISEPATYAAVPGAEGVIGVLPGHSSLISTLKPGVVEVTPANDGSGNKDRIFIAGGFADITAENVTILAEEATPVADLDREALEKQLVELKEDLGMAAEPHDKERIQQRLDIVTAKLHYAA